MIEARGWRETAGRARRGLEGRRAFPLWLSVRKQSEPRLREATHHHHGEALISRSLTPAHIQYVTVFILHRAYSTYSSSGYVTRSSDNTPLRYSASHAHTDKTTVTPSRPH